MTSKDDERQQFELHDAPVFRSVMDNPDDRAAILAKEPLGILSPDQQYTVIGVSKTVDSKAVMKIYRSFPSRDKASEYIDDKLTPYWKSANLCPPHRLYIVGNGEWLDAPPPETVEECNKSKDHVIRALESIYRQQLTPMLDIYDRVMNDEDDAMIEKLHALLSPDKIALLEKMRKRRS